jgi:4-hydroxy-2-oxoheptanedioate aldolase
MDRERGRFIAAVRAGRPAIVAGAAGSQLGTEVIALAGFDGCWIDLQHGNVDPGEVAALISVLDAHEVSVIVRVPGNEPGVIGHALDAGASAIVCPDVRTVEEAAAFAAACRYPPAGTRGYGPSRSSLVGAFAGSPVSTEAENNAVLAIAQIESPEGLENVEAIIGTPGIDCIFPGMVDYALMAEGRVLPGLSFLDESVRDPLERIVAATHAVGKTIGMPVAAASELPEVLELGTDWVLMGGELGWLIAGARATLATWNERKSE